MIIRHLISLCVLLQFFVLSSSTYAHNQRDYSYRGQEHESCQKVYWEVDEEGEDYEEFWYDSDELCLDCFFQASYSWTNRFFSPKNHRGVDFLQIAQLRRYSCICDYPRFYAGYLHFIYKQDFPFLKKQIAYSSKYPVAQNFWPENCSTALHISNVAVGLFKDLFRTTALKRVPSNKTLSKDYMVSSWYFSSLENIAPIATCASCFHFSDYYQVCGDLKAFSRRHFAPSEYRLIETKIADILDYLSTLFRVLYDEILEDCDIPELRQEIEFIENLYCDWRVETNTCPVCMPQKLSPKPAEFTLVDTLESINIENPLPRGICNEREMTVPLALPGEKITPPDWCAAPSFFARGVQYNDLYLFIEAIAALNQAILLSPNDSEIYLERAFAHFEIGQIDLALADFGKAKKLNGGKLANSPKVMRLGPMDYSAGLCLGIIEGGRVSAEELGPNMCGCASCLMQGIWAFACSPAQVSEDLIEASKSLIETLKQQSSLDYFRIFYPEVYELCCQWDSYSEYDRGNKLGFVIGKYGLDILIPAQAIKLYQKYRLLKIANTAFTLECMQASLASQQAILAEKATRTAKREAKRQAAQASKKLPIKNGVGPHIMTKHHDWHKLIELTGNISEDFGKAHALIEEHNIFNSKYFSESRLVPKNEAIKTHRLSHYRKPVGNEVVEIVIQTCLVTGEELLQNAYVVRF